MEHLIERNHVTTSQQYQRKRMKKLKKKNPKQYSTNGRLGLTQSNRNNDHRTKQNMEKNQRRKIYGT